MLTASSSSFSGNAAIAASVGRAVACEGAAIELLDILMNTIFSSNIRSEDCDRTRNQRIAVEAEKMVGGQIRSAGPSSFISEAHASLVDPAIDPYPS